MRSANRSASWFTRGILQALAVLLLAPLLVLAAPTQVNAQVSQVLVPENFGIAIEESDTFQFGTRVSTASFASSSALAFQFDESTCDSIGSELTRGGPNDQTYGEAGLTELDAGMRYNLRLCLTERTRTVTVVIPGDCYSGPPPTYTEYCEPPTITSQEVPDGEDVDVISWTGPAPHPSAHTWLKDAAGEAHAKIGDQLDGVWWSSSPHFDRRQVVGLNTWFAVSAQERSATDTVGEYLDGEREFDGDAGGDPDWPDEIFITIEVLPPTSTLVFSDGIAMECEDLGQLWTQGQSDLQNPDDPVAGLCVRSWKESSAVGDGVTKIELQEVELEYPWELVADKTNALTVLAALDNPPDTSGFLYSDKAGGKRDFFIGEVQTYGADIDGGEVPSETVAPLPTEWAGPETRTCDAWREVRIIGWFAGAVCDAIEFFVGLHATAFQYLWDGAKFVVTVVKVLASGAWQLLQGCIEAGSEFLQDIGETAGAVVDFVSDPAGQVGEVISTIDMVMEQLGNDETRWQFINEVLVDLVGEFLDLELIAEKYTTDGGVELWRLKDNPEWEKWIGKVACGILIAFVTGGVAKGLKASKFALRIKRFLNGGLPDIPPCLVSIVRRGPEFLAGLNDFQDIVNANVPENNSFPAGTPVLMANGSHRAIEDIVPGDRVMSFDHDTSQWQAREVTDQWSAIDDGQMATLTLADSSTVQATDGHLFWLHSADAWIELEDVSAGDDLLTPGGPVAVAGVVEHAESSTVVYELTVADNHNFAVNTGTTDVLVHNKCRNRGGDGGDGDGDSDFTQDPDTGVVTYNTENGPIEGVAVDGNLDPIVFQTDDFEIILMQDGTLTLIDGDGNIIPGGVRNPDGSITVTRDDGSQFIIDKDGDTADIDPGGDDPFVCNSFPTGTEVRQADGSYKLIEDIRAGDQVLSYDFGSETWIGANVSAQWSAIDEGVIATVELSDGATVSATDHHRFWVDGDNDWVELDDVDAGDALFAPTGMPVVANLSLAIEQDTLVWELSVEGTHNFTVRAGDHDLLVHNCDIVYNDDGSWAAIGEDNRGNPRTRYTDPDGNVTVTTQYADRTVIKDTVPTGAVDPATGVRNQQDRSRTEYPDGRIVIKKGSATSTTVDGVTTIVVGSPPNTTTTVVDGNGQVDGSNYSPDNPAQSVDISLLPEPGANPYTSAVGRGPNGELVHLRSGAGGPANTDINLDGVTPDVRDARSHVEGHAAAILAAHEGPSTMTMAIDHPAGTCSTCQGANDPFTNEGVPSILGPGDVLYVISPDGNGGTRVQQITSSNAPGATAPFLTELFGDDAQAIIDGANP